MLKWFSSTASVEFGKELATFVLSEFATASPKNESKFAARAERALMRADQRLQDFKTRERLNFYKKAKLANAFLWTLRDKGCPADDASQLTDWLSGRI